MTLSITFYDQIIYHRQDFLIRDADFFGNGVVTTSEFPATFPSTPNMTLNIGAGRAWVDGYRIANDSNPVILTVAPASSNPRIDIVQIGHDDVNQTYSLMVKQGVPAASNPIEPGADIGYVKLYAINVAAGATSITASNVIDRRTLIPLNVTGTQISFAGSAGTNQANTFTGGDQTMGSAGTATAASNFGSIGLDFQRSIWSGSAAQSKSSSLKYDATGKLNFINEAGTAVWGVDQNGKMSTNTAFSFLDSVNGAKSYTQQVNGDLWITSNAYYDGTNWQRVDTTKYAFAIQIQGTNNIPGESVQGVNIWRCVPGNNPIGAFTTYGGWETCLIFTGNQNMVVGGENLEIDGSGASTQYGRINQIADGTFFSKNAFYDGTNWQRDDTSKPASAIRIGPDGSIKTYYVAAGANPITWQINNVLDDGSGNFSAVGKVAKVKNVATAGNFGVRTVVANASDVQLTTIAATTIAQFTPTVQGNFEAKVYYRVITGTTNVTVQVTYTDASGAQTNTILNAQSTAVGSYSCLPVFFNATPGSSIQINVTASVANQVYASAVIEGC